MDVKQVIVVRKDLNMRKGKLAAQVAHASMKIFFDRTADVDGGRDYRISNVTEEMEEWIEGSFTKIVVGINSEKELMDLYIEAQLVGLPHALIQDAGKTEFKEPTYTCIAIGPAESEKIDRITGNLELL